VGAYLNEGILRAIQEVTGLEVDLEPGGFAFFSRDIEKGITTVTVRSTWKAPSRR
jgi:hypothetical protein